MNSFDALLTFGATVVIAVAVFAVGVPAQSFPLPCWETELGTDLGLGDDRLSPALPLGFDFPLPGGGTTPELEVSSNGFVYLQTGLSSSSQNNANVTALLDGPARIAAAWMDLDPASAGGVWFQTFPDRAVVTWDGVPEYPDQGPCRVQLQLVDDGSFAIALRALPPGTGYPHGSHDLLIGVTQGHGAADPGESDYSTAPLASAGDPTLYELLDFPSDPRDLVGHLLWFEPDGQGGYDVTDVRECRAASFARYGLGCPPKAPALYELFDVRGAGETNDLSGFAMRFAPGAGGSYTVVPCSVGCWEFELGASLGLGDDEVSAPQGLGFSATYAGVTTTEIAVSSNGFVYLVPGPTWSGCCHGDVALFLAGEPRVAALWQDLVPDPASGGTVRFHAMPGKAVVTWHRVREIGHAFRNTFQLQLFDDGSLILAYESVASFRHDALVGVTVGRGATDLGELDFTTGLPATSPPAGFTPLTLDAATGSLPRIGSTFTARVDDVPGTAVLGVLSLGFARLAIPLDLIGMPHCTLYQSGEVGLPLAITPGSSTAQVGIAIPGSSALVGASLFGQAIVLAPGTTALGVVASNGGRIALGL